MSVLCKTGELGKLRQIFNSRHSRVNMFLKTLLKAYVLIKDIKLQFTFILFFFKKKKKNHETGYVSYHFPIWKNNKVKNFLNPSSVHHFSSILRVRER